MSEFTKPKEFSLKDLEIRDTTEIPPAQVTVRIGGTPFVNKGDISFISGLAKSGKSTVALYLIASALIEHKKKEDDYLGIETTYCEGKEVIYIDTEQSKQTTKSNIDKIKKIANLKEQPKNFVVYNFRELMLDERRKQLDAIFESYPDAHLLVIDGITDFLSSVNDEGQSNELIRLLMQKASNLNISIVSLIHLTSGENPKARGHIGAEASRKCQGLIAVKKHSKEKAHSIEPVIIRGEADFDPIYYWFDPETKLPTTCSEHQADAIQKSLTQDVPGPKMNVSLQLKEILPLCFKDNQELSNKDLKIQLFKHGQKGEATVNRWIKQAVEENLIRKSEDGKYSLSI